jgi:hypothetical protein
MANNREPPTLADYVVTAISPALVIGVVSALVMFLAEVFYAGKYEGRLNHTLFYFSAGIVLVARISIVVDGQRAAIYGAVLAFVCWLALRAYIDYPPGSTGAQLGFFVNAVLIGIVWWCAYKLTWDCTFIDDNRKSSSKGLLALAGLETPRTIPGSNVVEELEESEDPRRPKTFFQRLREYRKRQANKPHTPGLTVIYFAGAALPIFGLGQSLIPASETSRRAFTFWLAAVYVGCSMGLLLTTSFLGLRRYLRQRKVQMPKAMTGVWLGLGGALVLGFVMVAAFLPRPYSETPLFKISRAGSSDRQASKNAQMKQDSGKGEGAAGEQTKAGDGKNTGKKGEPGKGKGDGKKGSGGEKSKDGSGKSKEKGKDGSAGDDKGEEKKDDGEKKDGEQNQGEESKNEASNQGDSMQRFQNSSLGKLTETIGSLLKWLVWIAIAVFILVLLFRGGLSYLANFFPWAKRWLDALNAWWRSLFGRKGEVAQAEAAREKKGPTHRPFTSFRNPFRSGTADQRSEEELIRYSFAALEAWSADRRQPRTEDETATEFAARLTQEYPAFETEANRLAGLVARMAYSDHKLPDNTRELLEVFWDRIVEVPTRIGTEEYELVE